MFGKDNAWSGGNTSNGGITAHRRCPSRPYAGSLIAVALVILGLIPSIASAAESRPPESPITTQPPIVIASPGGVAIDEGSGNVFLNDGTNVTDILGGAGGAPVALIPPYQLTGFNFVAGNNGVAVDNSPTSPSKGTLYVANAGGVIKRFIRNSLTEKYESAGSDLVATGPKAFTSGNTGLTVDTHGNLFFANNNCECVVKFSPAGVQLALYTLSGTVSQPNSVAVDGNGNLFALRAAQGSVFKYPAAGLPADGSGPNAPTESIQVLSTGSNAAGVAVDPSTNKLFIAFRSGPARVAQYNATTLSKDFEFGVGVLSTPVRLAVNSATNRIYVSDAAVSKKNVAVFGPPITLPSATTKAPIEVTGTKAILNGVVNPQGNVINECKFEYGLTTAYGKTALCEGLTPADSGDHTVTAAISDLVPNGTTYHFRLRVNSVSGEASPQGADRVLVTADTVITEPATTIGATSTTMNGIIRPEGVPLTGCKFEYGTTSAYGQTISCSPAFGSIPDDFEPHAVTGALSNLVPNTTYHFRIWTSNASEVSAGENRTFTTLGPPEILEQIPLNVGQDSATLRATINPRGPPTTYHFEFGVDTSYGTRIPADHELFVGSGTDPVNVSAIRGGLQEKSVYYFRVVAVNANGTTPGPDQRLETLNEHELPDDRGIELVSPVNKGPSGSVSSLFGSDEQVIQASEDGKGIAYPIQNGIPESSAGGWTRWQAELDSTGWSSGQISAPSLIPPPDGSGIRQPSLVQFASPNLSCAILRTHNPLTEDTPQASVELGLKNLYRWNASDGSYDLITDRVPLNPGINFEPARNRGYTQIEASDDCSRVYFRSRYEFISGASGLYEWEEGTLRDAGVLPSGLVGGSLSQPPLVGGSVNAVMGGEVDDLDLVTARWNAVSPDGSRLFFTARSDEGPDSGTPAIFMREDGGASVVDISQSETGVPTNGARFEAASPDGSRVFFRANYGIDTTSSAGPTNQACGPLGETETISDSSPPIEDKACDLYVYDVETEELTDLSASPDPSGAAIQGTVAVDEDGSHVYFAALGQLIPGKGRTYSENTAGTDSANIYLSRDGILVYVTTLERINHAIGAITSGDLLGGFTANGVLMRRPTTWSADTNADGDRLLFESAANLTSYDTGGGRAVYLYKADTGKIVCVSCPRDGASTLVPPDGKFKFGDAATIEPSLLARPRQATLTDRANSMSPDGNRIFFTSSDVLAPGAEIGKRNIYQWEQGQVSFLAIATPTGGNGLGEYLDASPSGDSVFIATAEQLVPEDTDFVSDAYNIRVGGGFPEQPKPPQCQVNESTPLLLNQAYCQGFAKPQPAGSTPASAGFQSSGNPPEPKPKCKKGQVRKHGKCVKRQKHGAKKKQHRAAKNNRGGAK